jgi:hypothetical protein
VHPKGKVPLAKAMVASDQQRSKTAVCSCTIQGPWCAARLLRWPLLMGFPMVSACGSWHWHNSPAARPATDFSRVTFQQPGLPEGGRPEPGGTNHPRDAGYHVHLIMAVRCRPLHLVTSGPSKLSRSRDMRSSGTGAELVDAAAWQHAGRTGSNLGSMCQSCAVAPLMVRPAFLHHGCCRPYGGIGAVLQRLLRWQLSRISPGTSSISSSSTDIDN